MKKLLVAAVMGLGATQVFAALPGVPGVPGVPNCQDLFEKSGFQAGQLMDQQQKEKFELALANKPEFAPIAIALMHICGIGGAKDMSKGIQLLEAEAAKNSEIAMGMLFAAYSGLFGVEQNTQKAKYWLLRTTRDASAQMQQEFAMELWTGPQAMQDHAAAERALLRSAIRGNVVAFGYLGQFYLEKKQVAQALPWITVGAEAQVARSQYQMGHLYANGFGDLVASETAFKNPQAQAVRWYMLAADKGFSDAQDALANAYENGTGVLVDLSESLKWRRKASAAGSAASQQKLRLMFPHCCVGDKEQERLVATQWYRLDAESGALDAQIRFASFLERIHQPSQAITWYRKAAVQESVDAMNALGRLYLETGPNFDQVAGLQFTRQAAAKGSKESSRRLAEIFQEAKIVPRNLVAAYAVYYTINGSIAGLEARLDNFHPEFEAQMSPREVIAAKQLVREMVKPGQFLKALDKVVSP